jgi:hypothetical protein
MMSTDVKTCISCGIPMRTTEEHSLGDLAKPFCKHCGAKDGTLKSYDEVLARMTDFLQRTQGLDGSVAREAAKGMMEKMPAWSSR